MLFTTLAKFGFGTLVRVLKLFEIHFFFWKLSIHISYVNSSQTSETYSKKNSGNSRKKAFSVLNYRAGIIFSALPVASLFFTFEGRNFTTEIFSRFPPTRTQLFLHYNSPYPNITFLFPKYKFQSRFSLKIFANLLCLISSSLFLPPFANDTQLNLAPLNQPSTSSTSPSKKVPDDGGNKETSKTSNKELKN